VWDETSGKYFISSIYAGSSTTYTVTGIEPSTSYSFGVTAVDTGNNSSRASIRGTTAQSDFKPPTTLSAVVVTGRWSRAIEILWSASTDNVGVVSYEVCNKSSLLVIISSNQTSYTLGTSSKETFYLSVKAKDRAEIYQKQAI
jgi:chitinase